MARSQQKKNCVTSTDMAYSEKQHKQQNWPPSGDLEDNTLRSSFRGSKSSATSVGNLRLVGSDTGSVTSRRTSAKKQTKTTGKSHDGNREELSTCKQLLNDILQNKITCNSTKFDTIIDSMGWERKCSSCRLTKWLGDPIILRLSHRDGNVKNNKPKNLELLCPNCLAQNSSEEESSDSDTCSDDSDNSIKKTFCSDCSVEISHGATRCIKCNGKRNRKTKRPSRNQLIEDKDELRYFTRIGNKYGVSDNAVRKWFKYYDIEL
jgi:hypothetical protein